MSKKFCPLLYRGVYLQYSTPFFLYSDLNPFINLFIIEMDGSFHCRVRDGLFYLVIGVIFSEEFGFYNCTIILLLYAQKVFTHFI